MYCTTELSCARRRSAHFWRRALTPLDATRPHPTRTIPQLLEGKPGAPKFLLHVAPGEFSDSQIVVMLGENGAERVWRRDMAAPAGMAQRMA